MPGVLEGDLLALFPVSWIAEINDTCFGAKPLLIEHGGNAHFELVGEMDHRFAKYLSDHAVMLTHEQWLAGQQSDIDKS